MVDQPGDKHPGHPQIKRGGPVGYLQNPGQARPHQHLEKSLVCQKQNHPIHLPRHLRRRNLLENRRRQLFNSQQLELDYWFLVLHRHFMPHVLPRPYLSGLPTRENCFHQGIKFKTLLHSSLLHQQKHSRNTLQHHNTSSLHCYLLLDGRSLLHCIAIPLVLHD